MNLNGKKVELVQLRQEGIAAGVSLPQALGIAGDQLITYTADGSHVEPPLAMTAVLAAHIPVPTKSAYRTVVVEDFQTTDATIASMVLWPLSVQTLYTARFTILAIDTGNGDCRVWYAKASAKRLGAGALLVGTPNIDTDHPNPGATSWAIAADVNGSNFRVRVTGAAGRTISWNLVGEVLRARPTGLVD